MYQGAYGGVNMCTRFVSNGDNTVVGFNFDIGLSVWTHTVIAEKGRFFIGIKMPDHRYRSFHGINRSGFLFLFLLTKKENKPIYK